MHAGNRLNQYKTMLGKEWYICMYNFVQHIYMYVYMYVHRQLWLHIYGYSVKMRSYAMQLVCYCDITYRHLFKIICYFNWRIIALQNFVIFCQIPTWISHRYTYVPSLLHLPPISFPIPPQLVVTEPLIEFPEPYSKFPLAVCFTYGNISFHVTLPIHLTLSFLPHPCPAAISLFSM